MENLEQDPPEIPMEDILAEIRQMLSNTDEIKKAPSQEKFSEVETVTKSSVVEQSIPAIEVAERKIRKPDYFLLTPAMRCDLPSDAELSASVQKQTARVMNRLHQETAHSELNPVLIEWLNKNLPAMIEKVISEKKNNG